MFVALVIKHAKRLRHIVTSFVCPALPYFSTLSHKQNDLQGGKKAVEHKMCVSIFSTTLFWNISNKNSARYYYKHTSVFM